MLTKNSSLITRFFPTPSFLTMPSVSLSVSDDSLRLVELGYHRGAIRLKNFDERSLPAGSVTEGQFVGDTPAEILEDLRREHKIKFINSSLPEEKGFVYTADLSQVENDETSIQEFLSFRFEENVPLQLNSSIFDFDIVQIEGGTPQAVVFAFDAEIIRHQLSVFKASGLLPLSFEPESRALARAVIDHHDNRTHALLHIKDQITNISIIAQRQVVFTSTVHRGFDHLGLNIESDEKTGLPWLKHEVDKIFHYWNSRRTVGRGDEHQVENIVICGEKLGAENMIETISDQLGPEIEIANVWKNITSFDRYIPEISYQDSFKYGVAIGLALSRL